MFTEKEERKGDILGKCGDMSAGHMFKQDVSETSGCSNHVAKQPDIWDITTRYVPIASFGDKIVIDKVLREHDFLLNFILGANGVKYFAHFVDDDGKGTCRYLVNGISEELIDELEAGTASILQALSALILNIMDIKGEDIVNSWVVLADHLPKDALPLENVFLVDEDDNA